MGWDNSLLDSATGRFMRDDQALQPGGAVIGDRGYAAGEYSVVLVNTDPGGVTTGFIGAETPTGVQTMARKLPHYGGYGRLVFDQASGRNLLKDALKSGHSTLSRQLGPEPVPLRLDPRPPLQPE